MSKLRQFTAISAAALVTAMVSVPAYAQESNDTSAVGNPEIVVTAQFREQKLQDTPLSITAVDSTLLESRNQTDLSQIARNAPNVTLNAMGGAYGSSLGASIRGIGQFDFNPAYEPGVGMYVDDVYYATLTGGVFDLLDLERVEVLRGPQGTLTGRNSIGGAIKLFSKKPTDENSGSVSATYGSRQRTDVRASANFVLSEGLYGRVSGVYKHQNGYVDQVDYGCDVVEVRPMRAAGALSGVAVAAAEPFGQVDAGRTLVFKLMRNGKDEVANVVSTTLLRPGDLLDVSLATGRPQQSTSNP